MKDVPIDTTVPLPGATSESAPYVPEALQPPTRRVGLPFVFSLALAQITLYVGFQPVMSILLPLQIEGLDAAHKVALLGTITGIAGLVALIINPLAGALSDRTTSRFGRRRPWLLAGAILIPASLVLMMSARSMPVLLIGLLGLQLFLNPALAALSALVPDQIPAAQRGVVSGAIGLAFPIASIVGAVIIGSLIQEMTIRYLVIAGIVLVILVPYALLVPDTRLPQGYLPPFTLSTFVKGFWIDPRKHPDFALVWLGRCVSTLGYSGIASYLLYYLQDAVHYTRLFPGQTITQGYAILIICSTVTLMIAIILGGILSDRFQRRKVFVIVSSIVMALALFIFAFFPSWSGAIVGAVLGGLGSGVFLSVDYALATQVLPSERDRAKDMGILSVALSLPQSLAPIIAASLLTLTHSYLILFTLAGMITLVGSFIIQPVSSVR